MNPFFFDTETYPIKPGLQAPPVVCGQWLCGEEDTGRVELAADFYYRMGDALEDPSLILVAHSAAYDMCVIMATWPDLIELVFDAYESDRVVCTKVREKLFRIAQGTDMQNGDKSLVGCADRYKIEHDYKTSATGQKEEYWRTRYALLKDTPPGEWPVDARRYALEDVRVLGEVFHAQGKACPEAWLADQYRQTRADFWLRLISCHGMRVDQKHAERFRQKVEAEAITLRTSLTNAGLVRLDATKDTKAAKALMVEVRLEKGFPIPLTPKGKELAKAGEDSSELKYVSTDADSCLESGSQTLVDFARFGSLKTLRSRVKRLQDAGDLPIQARFDVLKETGRTSCSKGETKPGKPILAYGDQLQNLNREAGLRECYVPRNGRVFCAADWRGAELHTLAQTCLDLGLNSNLAKVLNAGRDVHVWFGAEMHGWPYDWAQEARKGLHGGEAKTEAKRARQMAKAANFGFPGGLGVTTFRLFALKTYGVSLSEEEARGLKGAWFAAFPEMPQYFQIINGIIESGAPLKHAVSGRYRGRLTYCSACNSPFQGRMADMAKEAGFFLAKACYVPGANSVLFGSRPVDFIHDEFIVEVPEETAHECSLEIVGIMEDAGRVWCPDVPPGVDASLSRRWRKASEPVTNKLDGRSILWEDRPLGENEFRSGDAVLDNWKNGREY